MSLNMISDDLKGVAAELDTLRGKVTDVRNRLDELIGGSNGSPVGDGPGQPIPLAANETNGHGSHTTNGNPTTLHDAMAQVLRAAKGKPLTSGELAQRLLDRGWNTKASNFGQCVHAAARSHDKLFKLIPDPARAPRGKLIKLT